MNRNKIIMAAGALVLTAASAIAGRASTKWNNATKLYYTGAGKPSCTAIQVSGISSSLLTTGGTGKAQATLTTSGSGTATPMNLYSTSGCHTAVAVHFNG
jgi:hypothetical protein